MELMFIGADHEVTGSCHYLKVGDKHMLVDYGMEQGRNYYENVDLPVKPAQIDYVFLTHAHIDHSGMLPQLFARGFKGQILCTNATKELCEIMLLDSAHIQLQEAEYRKKKAKRRGEEMNYEPAYTMQQAQEVMRQFRAFNYGDTITLSKEVTFRFTDIGHLLGSASIELWLTEGEEHRKVVFSGDIGNINQPLLRDPQPTAEADYVIMESTYGDRLHEPPHRGYVEQLADIIDETLGRGGNLVIPAFAVGRTQVMLYYIKQIKDLGLIPGNNDFPVYVDSPMAVRATSVFEDNEEMCYDEEAKAMLRQGINPITFRNLHLSITVEESAAINRDLVPKVILSASGMCDAGRIKHHLKHNITGRENTILFVGYQSEGTLGRRLIDGADEVKIFGEPYKVNAQIVLMDGMSGHADKDGLLHWINSFTTKPKKVFVVHGEDTVTDDFARCLEEENGIPAMAPFSGTKFDLISGEFICITKGIPIAKASMQRSVADSYTKLRIAQKRLDQVIEASSGIPNKELDAFTKALNDLCRKYQIEKK